MDHHCLVCGGPTRLVIDLGRMPLADAFRDPDDSTTEFFYDLKIVRCTVCTMVQLEQPVAPELMFHARYPFFTGTSRAMTAHFESFGAQVLEMLPPSRSTFVVELGGNDGTLLAPLAKRGVRALNIEPSANVAAVAEARGVSSLTRFFDAGVAVEVREAYGAADAIIAANCVCHVSNIGSFFEGVRILLAPDGLFVFEDPYLGDILRLNAVDQFYDEHVLYFSLRSVQELAARVGLEVIDVAPQPTHGGSMRYFLTRRGARPAHSRVTELLARESAAGFADEHVFARFRSAVAELRVRLPALLRELADQGARVAGFGATAKSATTLNLCEIGPDLLPYISDTTPVKHGKLTPGMHIPVRPYEHFVANVPDYALLFAWNHVAEIRAANVAFEGRGGRWIVYVPTVGMI